MADKLGACGLRELTRSAQALDVLGPEVEMQRA